MFMLTVCKRTDSAICGLCKGFKSDQINLSVQLLVLIPNFITMNSSVDGCINTACLLCTHFIYSFHKKCI